MTTAWLFPGQDAFEPTTGLGWGEGPSIVAEHLALADTSHGPPLTDPAARRHLGRFTTAVVQPLLTALCLGIARHLVARIGPPDLVAGASLGEVGAWAVATDLDARAAIDIARARGQAMEAAATGLQGGMVAVRGDEAAIRALLTDQVHLGARNGPDAWVLTGRLGALRAVPGARPVPVTGPWHAPEMQAAAAHFQQALPGVAPPLRRPLYLNDGGRAALDGADAVAHLVRQLSHPADWFAAMRAVAAAGATRVVVIGPGRVLHGQIRAVAPHLPIVRTDTPDQLARITP